ncbi:hypothetical protein [Mesorhizobium huakuii]|uniref:Uncharacterized protein n=1 Tax=Mesorhizobium huakuii TaxID=28104 RepID=A0A7G6T0N6_9HYPH|nr:hypothetical protein [Mesorhizobium huakuii]QND60318.1 hypothetical protein HB778_30050 [Mesorhizobium huakuii]
MLSHVALSRIAPTRSVHSRGQSERMATSPPGDDDASPLELLLRDLEQQLRNATAAPAKPDESAHMAEMDLKLRLLLKDVERRLQGAPATPAKPTGR